MSSGGSRSRRNSGGSPSVVAKKPRTVDGNESNLIEYLNASGLILKYPPQKCVAIQETVMIVRNLKKSLQQCMDYPRNISKMCSIIEKECQDLEIFKHYLFPNILRQVEDSDEEYLLSDSVLKILLNIPILNYKLIDFIFEKAMDLAVDGKCGPWIRMILKCFCNLDTIDSTDKISSNLVNLLDITREKMVRLEIITAIPDIVGDQEHENIANEMSRFLSEDHDLIPAILDCLSYLCLSDDQYETLQRKVITILMGLTKCNYYANFVKFLLLPGRMNETTSLESVQRLRDALGWPASSINHNEIATSQVLTAGAIRNSIISSKVVANSWLKVVSACKINVDHKAIDVVVITILYSTTEERQKQVENIVRKQIKLSILKEDLLQEAFEKFKPILREYLKNLVDLSNTLLKSKGDTLVEMFASQLYYLMYSQIEDCRQTIIAELLQLGLDQKQCMMNILSILNAITEKDMSLLKPQSLQILMLLDRMDEMCLDEIKAVMNLVCGLAYSYENSFIKDDVHMIIRKELSSSCPTIKVQGILASIYAIKYLVSSCPDEDHSVEMPDDVSYSSVTYLKDGPLREAAQLIELISRSTRQFPDLIAFFYDELSQVISSTTFMNKQFMAWLMDAVTNDLQQNFIIDSLPTKKVGDLQLSMQYCLNADSEMDEIIAINIAPLALQSKDGINVSILSPLFQLVQILHFKQHDGNLSSIDALLGCPVIMPKFDIDLIEELDHKTISNILDCLIYCANWFRELANAFATQEDEALKCKLLNRIMNIKEIEKQVTQILIQNQFVYKPPLCTFDISKYTGNVNEKKIFKQALKQKSNKKVNDDDTVLPETAKSQPTQNSMTLKSKLDHIGNIPLRPLSLKLIHLLNIELSSEEQTDSSLNIYILNFLLKSILPKVEDVMASKIKKNTFLTKNQSAYNPKIAEVCAKSLNDVLPKIMSNFKLITSMLAGKISDTQQELLNIDSETLIYLDCLELFLKLFSIYFKWIGFKTQHVGFLKTSLRTIASCSDDTLSTNSILSLKELLFNTAKFLSTHEKYCLQLSTAVSLIEFLLALQVHTNSRTVAIILRDISSNFLSKQWRTPDGILEKGLFYNQSIDRLAHVFFANNEMIALKNIIIQLTSDVEKLKSRNDILDSFKSINKGNFTILYRNLGQAVYEATKTRLNQGLTNAEHLELWKDVANILKYMSDIAKSIENRNNLAAFFKKSLPILKLFLSQGIPIIELQFKNHTQEILEILKILQQSTRFLQSLCCHSRIKKDSALMAKVPFMRQLLETLIYKVKAALAANKCSEAFWMGNLKNKNIHGEVIATQLSVDDLESVEDCDEQLPDDDDIDDSDDEVMINPESKSLSDVV